MWYVRTSLICLGMAFVTPSYASIAYESRAANVLSAYHGNAYVLVQYITREEQQKRAQENLERHRHPQQERPAPSVDRSTNTYGKEWLEQPLQGDKRRVVRPY